jgi:uncharacterized protein YmfQ (DUF2313 family)
MVLFARRDVEEYTNSLADYLPGGCLFASAHVTNSNFRKLLRGMAGELFRANGLLKEYSEQVIPDLTTKFINEWESALGIPDECFTGAGSLTDRRRDILTKLAALGVQTRQDFIDLAAIFGVTITINAGIDEITFPLTFPVVMFTTVKESRFTIVVRFAVQEANRFPLVFPITFGSGEIAILECLFTKLKPANCDIIFQQV